MRYFLLLRYYGGDFHGWQRQPNATSVQQTIEDSLSTILRRKIEITGAGRTDTGVHASQMYAHLDIDDSVDQVQLLKSANRMVGRSIALDALLPVKEDAHARFDALSRTYSYYISLRKDPFNHNYSHFLPSLPDLEIMNEGGRILLNIDDFTSFAKLHADTKTNICRVTEAQWTYDSGNSMLRFTITADRFLRNMVRSIVGTLLDLGRGRIDLDGLKKIIEKKDRCEAGTSMPAKGLFLERIEYPRDIFIDLP